MRHTVIQLVLLASLGRAAARADVVTLNPVADAFVSAANPTHNYGGAGALATAAPGLAMGEFQTLFRFDTASARDAFDASLGLGRWQLDSITLQTNWQNPTNPLFNHAAPGSFTVSWMKRDDWDEGVGTPNIPSLTGVSFDILSALINPADEDLGTFEYDGTLSGPSVRALALTPSFAADVQTGSLVTLRLRAADATVSMLMNSRSFMNPVNHPVLTITAIPIACYANCDGSTTLPLLTANDFQCFLNRFAGGDTRANCDGSTATPLLNANDFQCFLNEFAAGCS